MQNGEGKEHVEETIYDLEQYLGWKERRKTDLATHRSRILDILHIRGGKLSATESRS